MLEYFISYKKNLNESIYIFFLICVYYIIVGDWIIMMVLDWGMVDFWSLL